VAPEEVRRHNLTAVLDRLHRSGPMSRSELAQKTGLNRSTIADLIGELSRLGLVEEKPGTASAGPGRPSPVVSPRPKGATVLAVEFSVDSVAVATVGLGGHVYGKVRQARARGTHSVDETIEEVARMARALLDDFAEDQVLVGMGVAVVGVVRRRDGFVHLAPNLGWKNVPLGALLGARFGLGDAVMAANEADLGALAEFRRGAGVGATQLVYVNSEVGIGAGIIQDGQPMLGAAGYAGEAGHTLINPDGKPCTCGARGCWETEAGEAALAERAGLTEFVGQQLIEEITQRVDDRDPQTLQALQVTGTWLGYGIGNLINVFNPDVVVIGGLYQELYPYLREPMEEAARSVVLQAPGEAVRIVRGSLGVDASLLGAAEMALSPVIADPAGVRAVTPTEPPDRVEA